MAGGGRGSKEGVKETLPSSLLAGVDPDNSLLLFSTDVKSSEDSVFTEV